MSLLFHIVAFSFLAFAATAQDVDCRAPKNSGVNCPGTTDGPKQRFYFNDDYGKCLPFRYNGCNGNTNNFENIQACYRCMQADRFSCMSGDFGVAVQSNSRGQPAHCGETNACPDTHVCRSFWPFPRCCDKKAENDGVCPDGSRVNESQMGETCEDLICPNNSECNKGFKWARCCPTSGNAGPAGNQVNN